MRSKNHFLVSATLIFTACLTFSSCSNQAKDTACTNIYAPILKNTDTDRIPSISRLGFSIDTVRLKTTDASSFVSYVHDIRMTDEYIFFLTNDERVLQFSSTGEFIRRIGYKGRGPGEYLSARYFDILPEKEEVYVAGSLDGEMEVYSFAGKHLRTIPLSFHHFDFVVKSNGHFLFYERYGNFEPEAPAGLAEFDAQGNFIKTVIPNNIFLTDLDDNLFHVAPGVIGYYNPSVGDTVFHITQDTVYAVYTISGDKKLTQGVPPEERNMYGLSQYKIMYCTETDRVVNIGVMNQETVLRVVYDKINNKTYSYKNWEDQVIPQTDRAYLMNTVYNGNGFHVLDAGDILASPELQKQFPEITEDSNPILLILH
ncbi:MAG: 6-bladed beta-propeller [Bacteroidaceae bacterium]|nr:6-bladed beta-propeller [Bacteroidaceae bacterium]